MSSNEICRLIFYNENVKKNETTLRRIKISQKDTFILK